MKHADTILAELRRRERSHEPPPTLRELAAVCGLRTYSTIFWKLEKLERLGLVRLGEPNAKRAIWLTDAGRGGPSDEALLRECYHVLEGWHVPIVEKLRERLGVPHADL